MIIYIKTPRVHKIIIKLEKLLDIIATYKVICISICQQTEIFNLKKNNLQQQQKYKVTKG